MRLFVRMSSFEKSGFKAASLIAVAMAMIQASLAATIHVPADQPTIQAAISSASAGDLVLVSPGTYVENLDFQGKAIVVRSSKGAAATIIDGNQTGPVVSFTSGETLKSVLQGFTLRNGSGNESTASGGGIYCQNSSPTIENNVITANVAAIGGGIAVNGGSPYIFRNNIVANIHDPNGSGGWGGGISLSGGSSAVVASNRVSNHDWISGLGGGIAINEAGSPVLRNNLIFNNIADGNSPGGGVWIVDSSPVLLQNLIFLNTAYFGGGIYIDLSSTSFQAMFVNNTFAGNVSNNGILPGDGSAAYVVGFADNVQFFNNIFRSSIGRESFFCAPAGALPGMSSNDGFSTSGDGFGGSCSTVAGTDGNVSSDPGFANMAARNYRLSAGSPAIDAGNNSAPHLPQRDLANQPRIVDGNHDGVAVVDMGAYEYQP